MFNVSITGVLLYDEIVDLKSEGKSEDSSRAAVSEEQIKGDSSSRLDQSRGGEENSLVRQTKFQPRRPTLIHGGPPKRYRLHTERKVIDDYGKVKKWTYGIKDTSKPNKIVLLVGETGAGKTTLINTMVNYLLGVQFEEELWYEITEEATRDQSESQTSEITMYEVCPSKNPESLTIIDTPGYGDTRGLEKYLEVAENLAMLFQSNEGVREVDAVCFVIEASKNRLSDRQHYIISSILSLFGKDIVNNIMFLITHSDGLPPKNVLGSINKAKIPCRRDHYNQPVHFLFNNQQADARQYKKRYVRAQRDAWEDSMEEIKIFLQSLDEKYRRSLELTSDVLIERIRFEAFICNIQLQIQETESKKSEKIQIQEVMRQNKEKIEKRENFTVTVKKPVKEKDLKEIETRKLILLFNAHKTIKHLSQIALKPDSAFTLQHLDFFIPRVREAGKEDWVRELEEMRRTAEAEEANKDALSYLKAGLAKLQLFSGGE